MATPLSLRFRPDSVSGGASLTGLSAGRAPQPSSIAKPPAPARHLTPPSVRSTTPSPQSRVRAPAAGRNQGVQSAATNYGLPTTGAAARAAYNPFGMPTTVGDFNARVNAAAAPGYQPQLDQNSADISAEDAANKLRTQDIASIYSQYNDQTTKAFNDTRDALNAIIAQEKGGNGTAGQLLSSALGSAAAPQSATAAMMGLTPAAASALDTSAYTGAANATAGAVGQDLGTIAEGELTNAGEARTAAGIERASQTNTESQRHGAALQTLQGNRDTIVAGIPAIIEKAREQLQTDLINAQDVQFQQNLASKQFGLSKAAQNANIANAAATTAINAANSASNRANARTQLGQNQETINLNAKQVQASIDSANAKLAAAEAKAQGQQEANAIKYLQGWIQPTKAEIIPAHREPSGINSQGQTTYREVPEGINTKAWHRDAGAALKTLMVQYGLSLSQALNLMSSIDTPIGGGQKGTIGQWASTFMQRMRTPMKTTGTLTPGPPPINTGGNTLSRTPAFLWKP